MTGVGVLCMQLLGAAKAPEARKGLAALQGVTFEWEPAGKTTKWNELYHGYLPPYKQSADTYVDAGLEDPKDDIGIEILDAETNES